MKDISDKIIQFLKNNKEVLKEYIGEDINRYKNIDCFTHINEKYYKNYQEISESEFYSK